MCLKICKGIRSIFKVLSKLPFNSFKEKYKHINKTIDILEKDKYTFNCKEMENEILKELNQIFRKG